ncbi:hypothetical protein Rruber_01110 [Rhodococcus ruber]|uniref:Putative TetR family transcriptional regulator n=1 Tax=Rhodococcus ruber TaxID=1830 RepID=A0A098BVC8_9NOCA|nr:putative TetR family transcriptional regulator [Rhodococcus ruber]
MSRVRPGAPFGYPLVIEHAFCYGPAVPRPRIHDLDEVLDATENLVVAGGASAVTLRAVAAATGMSNGALYHAFGSRGGLVGRAWLRAAHRFLDLQRAAVDEVLGSASTPDRGIDAVVAAADAPAAFAALFPESSRLLLTVRREELLGSDPPADVAAELGRLDSIVVALLVRLSRALWGRGDARAVAVVEDCVVGLPTGLLLRRGRVPDAAMRHRLEAAVRAVLALDPPPAPSGRGGHTKGSR